MTSKRETVTAEVTTYLRRIGSRRANKTVTADDVQNYLDRNQFRGDSNERLSIVRSVLQTPSFRPTGYAASNRTAARGRQIRQWTVNSSR